MADLHRALEWLSRRRDGESAAYIAHRAGVTEAAVLYATRAYGPFPRPTRQLGRTTVSDERLSERAREWVQDRRRGWTVREIADRDGVAHQVVSRDTVGHGPFPSLDTVEAWAAARVARQPLTTIGREWGVPANRVAHFTKSRGPFPHPTHAARLPDGLLGIAAVAQRVGISSPSVLRWRDTGRLPAPDFVTARGRDVWLEATIDRWLQTADLEECPVCGARVLSLSRHQSLAHRSG